MAAEVDDQVSDREARMPAESEPHERTLMCFPRSEAVWGEYLVEAQETMVALARAIAEFEPVLVCVAAEQAPQARGLLGGAAELIETPVDDVWIRDTGPVFTVGSQGVSGVDLNFNAWGGKSTDHDQDATLAARLLAFLDLPRLQARVVGEGGGLEVDGQGTLLATASSWVNDNRNPAATSEDIEEELGRLFGVDKVIWLPGVRGMDVTDDHIDSEARFACPGVVLLNRPAAGAEPTPFSRASDHARQVLSGSTDAAGRTIEVVDLPEPGPHAAPDNDEGSYAEASYVNYYVCNGAVIAPQFGDTTADDHAAGVLGDLYPGRRIVQVSIHGLAAAGGGIHCATTHQPVARPSW